MIHNPAPPTGAGPSHGQPHVLERLLDFTAELLVPAAPAQAACANGGAPAAAAVVSREERWLAAYASMVRSTADVCA